MSMRDEIEDDIKNSLIPERFKTADLMTKPTSSRLDYFTIGAREYKKSTITTNLNNLSKGPGARQGAHIARGASAQYEKYSSGEFSVLSSADSAGKCSKCRNEKCSQYDNSFITYLADLIKSEKNFTNKYTIRGHSKGKNAKWIEHNKQSEWDCKSIKKAFDKYYWDGKDFAETKTNLDGLKAKLSDALINGDADMLKASWAVLEWGGVKNFNGDWLVEQFCSDKLVNTYKDAMKKLDDFKDYITENSNPNPNPNPLVEKEWVGFKKYRMNAGYTKIFSLLLEDFIIYDSRVAAALGLLVVKYCINNKLTSVPCGLRFPYMDAKENKNSQNPKNRNPNKINSNYDKSFPAKGTSVQHAEWNVRANIILSNVVKQSTDSIGGWDGVDKTNKQEQLRALECALFMIGYDLKYA